VAVTLGQFGNAEKGDHPPLNPVPEDWEEIAVQEDQVCKTENCRVCELASAPQ
jgi:hypothetical protein